ncbi:MAG: hypothetical protein MJH08_16145, partial [Hyphomicrobiales bacterium]|nr:hypothetical protein [Hyphomicrobiales bacterium]
DIVSEDWQPCSPATGQLDAFQWKAPMQQNSIQLDADGIKLLTSQPPEEESVEQATVAVVTPSETDLVVEAEVVGEEKAETRKGEDAKAKPADKNAKVPPAKTEQKIPAKPENDNVSGEKAEPKAKANDGAGGDDSASPYKKANLDPDQDGVLDHRPDDPGISDADSDEAQQKKGWLF